MGFFSFSGGLISNSFHFIGKVQSNIVTSVANTFSSVAHGINNVVHDTTESISNILKPIPIIGGVAEGASTIINGATHGAEIVVQHSAMWLSEAGQAIDTVVSTTGTVISDLSECNIGDSLIAIKDGVGEIIGRDIQYLQAHIKHDAEIIQIPIHAVSEAAVDILKPIIGDNCISNSPKILDELQQFIIDDVIRDSFATPLLNGLENFSDNLFGDVAGHLTHSDMGMGWHTEHTVPEIQLSGLASPELMPISDMG